MSTPLAAADLLTLVQAARRLPGATHPATVGRWCLRGVRAADGSRVRLAHVRIGRRIFVAAADLDGFVGALTAADVAAAAEREAARPAARVPIAQRIAAAAETRLRLQEAGLL